ncbi:SCP-like extracellular [Sphingomonas sp. MAH-20]|uniref:SCP-like extracellular n=1 Tax=Sphingomonas horti TaxID=2682842 RepID=A0A6I4J327_9SPHN|nr:MULTISPECIES: CAP domain-containing protein [Sphingomonas]MBA2918736.1 SCP-like extracellular [Sphingomonas sp. CGMCC 1.13658]MVO78767.1 SCP-like extracellular [Sphingomonas horti]
MHRVRLLCTLALVVTMPCLAGAVGRTSALEARLLAAHNRERAALGVPALAWDDSLAAGAKVWAETLARTGRFEHSRSDDGENLWAGTRGAWSPEEMVSLWLAEKSDYRPGIFPAVSRSGDVRNVGHYTQVIWRSTRRLGCALASAREDVLVCRYAEGGNVIGERPI